MIQKQDFKDEPRLDDSTNVIIQPISHSVKNKQPKTNKIILLIVFLTVIFMITGYFFLSSYLANTNQTLDTNNPDKSSKSITNNVDASNYFGFNFFHALNQTSSIENHFISPLSLSMALDMATNGASGQTLQEMKNVLGINQISLTKVNNDNKVLINSLSSNTRGSAPSISIANSIWADKKYSFTPDFIDLTHNYYNSESRSLDFSDPKSLNIINDWVSNKTKGKINHTLDNLSDDAYLINTIYFKGSWKTPFTKELTENRNFSLEDGQTSSASLMQETNTWLYSEDKNVQIVSLPYKGDRYSMVIFLPKRDIPVDTYINSLDWQKYNEQLDEQKDTLVDLTLPKFSIERGGDTIKTLEALGLKLPFSNQAEFPKMTKEPVKISKVIHKTFIDVDEEGTEAAATTAIGIMIGATASKAKPPKPIKMIVNHPFFFTIQDNTNNNIIFMGSVKDPGSK